MESKKIRKISNTQFLEIDKQQQQNIITNTQKKFYLYRRHKYFRWKFMQLVIFVYIFFFFVRFYLILFDMHATCYLSLSVLCMCFARKCADGGKSGNMSEFEIGIENQSWLWSIAVWIGYLWSFDGDRPSYSDDSPTYSFFREFL